MLTVLAVHLDATKNALNVPDIYSEGTSPHLPIGAIALSAAAVRSRVVFPCSPMRAHGDHQLERIFTLYASRLMKHEVNSKKKAVWGPTIQSQHWQMQRIALRLL